MITRKTTLFLCICCCLTLFSLSGCNSGEEKNVKKAVEAELNRLKDSDAEIVRQYLKTEDTTLISENKDSLSKDITRIFQLFYKDFSYETGNISITENSAVVHTKLKIMNSKKLAKDFARLSLQKSIEQETFPSEVQTSAADSYALLGTLLESGEYKTQSVSADISLKKKGESWKIIHTEELNDILTGNFFSYITNANLLSPSEIVETHFDTIKGFDSEQLKRYLSLDSNSLTQAVTEQIHQSFHFEIKGENTGDNSAMVQTAITSVDFEHILQTYREELSRWGKTSEALSGGFESSRRNFSLSEKFRPLTPPCVPFGTRRFNQLNK